MTDETERLKPEIEVWLDGRQLAPAAASDIDAARVSLAAGRAGGFELVVNDAGRRWTNDPLFFEAREVELRLGYGGRLASVFRGEITAWRTEIERDGPSALVLRGMDGTHRLMRARRSRAWHRMGDGWSAADIARQIALEHGLAPRVDGDAPRREHWLQADESDFHFLLRLAAMDGRDCRVEGAELHFRPRSADPPVATFRWGENIAVFCPLQNHRAPMAEVEVRGWDAGRGESVQGVAAGPSPRFGAVRARAVIASRDVVSRAQAESLARATLEHGALEHVTAELEVAGRPELLPGRTVRIENVGEAFSGRYEIREANHLFDAAGYATFCQVRRLFGDV